MEQGVTCVVPARLGSTRFFGKLLQPLLGKPVVVHTLERAAEAACFENVICLTDSVEIAEAVRAHGFACALTGDAENGTERIARHLDALPTLSHGEDANLIVNLQGDEPAFPVEGLRTLCDALRKHPDLVHLLVHTDAPSTADLENPNRVKVAVDALGFVRDFVRTIPDNSAQGGLTSAPTVATYRLQLGAYGYSRKYLTGYAALPRSAREVELSHEILRAAPHQPGWAPIRAHFSAPGASVDVPEDLDAALTALNNALSHTTHKPQAELQGILS
jgi:3-deoxy-manno-octulosonate cytidylyltransferase (CMP-KDO synthetase)